MSEEAVPRVHPLRQAAVFLFAPLIIMDTFLLVFTTTLLADKLGAGIMMGFIGAVSPAVNMVFGPLWGWVADRYGRRLPLILGGFFTVPALIGFVFAT